ncbi:YgaP family membrane protein [Marinobacter nauticus]|uniref:YgaP family membrane protein n=1 Tax=Marinobacter nauticus TaxID=2743 RepID=UPI003AF9AD48
MTLSLSRAGNGDKLGYRFQIPVRAPALRILLAHYVSPYWLLFTGFVALNRIQSAFTRWCPAMMILRKLGLRDA